MAPSAAYPVRTNEVAWRDVAGEVVVVEGNGTTVRLLNKTASFIWTLADGTMALGDIGRSVHSRFEISLEEAEADTNEFCRQLAQEGLISLNDAPAA